MADGKRNPHLCAADVFFQVAQEVIVFFDYWRQVFRHRLYSFITSMKAESS
jgi:hypothetical protein